MMISPGIEVILSDSFSIEHGFESVRVAPEGHPDAKAIEANLRQLASSEGATIQHQQDVKSEEQAKADHFDLAYAENVIDATLLTFGGAGGAVAFFKVAKSLILKWRELSSRHKIKVKVGDVLIEISGEHDVDKVIKAAEYLLRCSKRKPKVKSKAIQKHKPA